jgi:release factor glutamine methyltransferase
MQTVLDILKKTTDFFASKGVDHPRLNAELLLGHALGLKRMDLYLQFERPLTEQDLEKIRPLVRRRVQREPLQYILGETEFCGLRLRVDRRALIPRPETELLVEKIIALLSSAAPAEILDLGTGSGAIALALSRAFPSARVTAVDSSEACLALAGENATAAGLMERVHLVQSDWFSAFPSGQVFDLIVANPPYLSPAEVAETTPEVRGFEPTTALAPKDGLDGLEDLRRIIAAAPPFLRAGGLLALETGPAQHTELLALTTTAGFVRSSSEQDLTERDRFVFAWK